MEDNQPKRIYTTLPRNVQGKSVEQMTEEIKAELCDLKKQASIEPKKCSECLVEMIKFTEDRKLEDPMVNQQLLAEANPFAQAKMRCNIL